MSAVIARAPVASDCLVCNSASVFLNVGGFFTDVTDVINRGSVPFRCASEPACNTVRTLALAHINGMQPLLMLSVTPVLFFPAL